MSPRRVTLLFREETSPPIVTNSPGDFEGVDLHSHADHVDSFYVLEGEAEFTVGNDVFRAGAGSWVAAPAGIRHGFRNAGEGELRMLNVHAPNVGFARRLRGR